MCDTITGGMDQREVAGRAAVRASAPFPLLARLLFWYVAASWGVAVLGITPW